MYQGYSVKILLQDALSLIWDENGFNSEKMGNDIYCTV